MSLPLEWRILAESVNGRAYVGQPGVRDPDSACEGFEPGAAPGDGKCEPDGHYLCLECVHIDYAAWDKLKGRTPAGKRLVEARERTAGLKERG